MAQNSSDIVRRASTLTILWGVSLICLGMLALASPLVAAVAVNVLVAWLIGLAGVIHPVVALLLPGGGWGYMGLLVGLLVLFVGVFFFPRPLRGVAFAFPFVLARLLFL